MLKKAAAILTLATVLGGPAAAAPQGSVEINLDEWECTSNHLQPSGVPSVSIVGKTISVYYPTIWVCDTYVRKGRR